MAAEEAGGNQGEPETSDTLKTFGAVLKALREEADETQETLAPKIGFSAAYVAKIEQGKRYPTRDFVQRAGEFLGPTAQRVLEAAARSLTRRVGLASWFRHWAALETEAVSLLAYECRVIPGLLQSEPYIRAICERRLPPLTEAQIEKRIAARLLRQQLFTDLPHTMFGFVIEQALLERHFGGVEVTRSLISHLLEQGARRNVEIQVMPLRQEEHAGFEGSMYLAETMENRWVGYIEGHENSILITAPKATSPMVQRYGRMRSQALSREDTRDLLTKMLGAL